jgi:serine protease Do
LQNAQGESIADNDDGDGSHSVLNVVLPETGTYDLIATGYNMDSVGAYSLKADSVQRDDRSILQPTSAQLSPEDESITSIYTRQGDRYTFPGKAGQNILINLESDDFDTYVILQNERGETIAENDDNMNGSNSTIQVTLPESGTYQVLTTTFNEGSTGAYRLTVQEQRILTPAIVEVTEGKLGN